MPVKAKTVKWDSARKINGLSVLPFHFQIVIPKENIGEARKSK